MFVVERWLRQFDRFQQRHPWLGFPLAVAKKFGDDQAGNLAALFAYYAFFSLFPLLLLLITILGIVLQNNPTLQKDVLHSALVDFPVIGQQLQDNVHSLNRTGIGLVVGIVGTLLGARGVANALQNALNNLWNVPFVHRPGFPWNQLRSLGILAVAGLGVGTTAALSGIGGGVGAIGAGLRVAAIVLSAAANAGLFLLAFRLGTAKQVPWRHLAPGAIAASLAWQVLLALGGYLISHQLRHASSVYGTFGLVLGLLSWLFLQAQLTLYAVEADVVRINRLWPRSLLQPPLAPADRKAYTQYAQAEQRRPEQSIDVTFTDPSQASEQANEQANDAVDAPDAP